MRFDRYLPKFQLSIFRVPAFLKRHASENENAGASLETNPDVTGKKNNKNLIYLSKKMPGRLRKWLRGDGRLGEPFNARRTKSPVTEDSISYMDMDPSSSTNSDSITPHSGRTAAHPTTSLPPKPAPEARFVLTNNIHWEEYIGPINPECPISFLDMKLDTPNKASGHFGCVAELSNRDNEMFIGKTSYYKMLNKNGEIKDDLAHELNAYKTIYQAENVGRHPNLVNAYGIATIPTANGPMRTLLMDHIPGPTGTKIFDDLRTAWNSGAISSSEYHSAIQYIGRKLMEVAQHISMAGIVHNDIKPANFLVNEKTGEPVLIDLGLWEKKGTRRVGGTRAYTSPEAEKREQVNELSDLFTVGATLIAGIEGKVEYGEKEKIYYDKKRFPYHTANYFALAPNRGLQLDKEIPARDKNNQVIRQPGTHAIKSAYSKAMESVLEKDPTRRVRFSDIKDIPFFNDSILGDIESKQVITKVISLSYTSKSKIEIARTASIQERLSNLTQKFNRREFKELQDISRNDAALADILSMEFPSQSQIEKERKLHTEINEMINRSKQWLGIAKRMAPEINSLTIKSGLNEDGTKIKTNINPDTQEPKLLQANLIAFRANLAYSISRNFGTQLTIGDLEAHLAQANTLLRDVTGLKTNNASLSSRIKEFSTVVFKMRQLIAVDEESRIKTTFNTPTTIKDSDHKKLLSFFKERIAESSPSAHQIVDSVITSSVAELFDISDDSSAVRK